MNLTAGPLRSVQVSICMEQRASASLRCGTSSRSRLSKIDFGSGPLAQKRLGRISECALIGLLDLIGRALRFEKIEQRARAVLVAIAPCFQQRVGGFQKIRFEGCEPRESSNDYL